MDSSDARQFIAVHVVLVLDNFKFILDFFITYDFGIMNTCFKKKEEHQIIYWRVSLSSQIHFVLVVSAEKEILKRMDNS